jgi:polyhydroxyalkanoate synthesis repressor PhaR
MLHVKKYPNRRLYDTRASRYITIAELERLIREGEDVSILDAQDGRDLTQETLTQMILERGGGRILPTSLLLRLIRLDDVAFAEFLTRYVGWALEVYVGAKQRAKALLPINPLATAPFAATDALARLMLGAAQWGSGQRNSPAAQPPPAPAPGPPPIHPPVPEPIPSPEGISEMLEAFSPPPEPPPPPVKVADEVQRLREELDALKASFGQAGARTTKTAKTANAKKSAKRRASSKR